MINAVVINCRESGINVYYKNCNNDINVSEDELSSFLHMINTVYSSKDEVIINNVKNLRFEQFKVTINKNKVEFVDEYGVHKKLHYHFNNVYDGFFSVHESLRGRDTRPLFESLTSILGPGTVNNGVRINNGFKKKLDEAYYKYCTKLLEKK